MKYDKPTNNMVFASALKLGNSPTSESKAKIIYKDIIIKTTGTKIPITLFLKIICKTTAIINPIAMKFMTTPADIQ